MRGVYDQYYQNTKGNFKSGERKKVALLTRQPLKYLRQSPLREFLDRLYRVVAVRYERDPGLERDLEPDEQLVPSLSFKAGMRDGQIVSIPQTG